MDKLKIDVGAYGTREELKTQIEYSLSLGLTEMGQPPCKNDGTFVIVGSGPSLNSQEEAIRREVELGRPLCSVNGGHDWLMEKGITPDMFLTTDPRPMPQNFKHINDETLYMIASRCHKDTFDTLKGRRVLLWHAWMDSPETDEVLGDNRIAIGGGTTSGLRAITVGYVQGFRKFHLYGMDSCLDSKKAKRWDSGPLGKNTKTIDVIVGGETFLCNMAMAQQADDFQQTYDVMPDASIKAFGGGLIAAIIEQRVKRGFHA